MDIKVQMLEAIVKELPTITRGAGGDMGFTFHHYQNISSTTKSGLNAFGMDFNSFVAIIDTWNKEGKWGLVFMTDRCYIRENGFVFVNGKNVKGTPIMIKYNDIRSVEYEYLASPPWFGSWYTAVIRTSNGDKIQYAIGYLKNSKENACALVYLLEEIIGINKKANTPVVKMKECKPLSLDVKNVSIHDIGHISRDLLDNMQIIIENCKKAFNEATKVKESVVVNAANAYNFQGKKEAIEKLQINAIHQANISQGTVELILTISLQLKQLATLGQNILAISTQSETHVNLMLENINSKISSYDDTMLLELQPIILQLKAKKAEFEEMRNLKQRVEELERRPQ